MKIQARVTGDVLEISDEGARTLIDAGIYEEVTMGAKKKTPAKTPAPAPKAPKAPKAPAPDKSTKVAPMTTGDMPTTPGKVA